MAGNKEVMRQFQADARRRRLAGEQSPSEKPTQYFVRKETMDSAVEQLETKIADLLSEIEQIKESRLNVQFPNISTVQKSVSIPVKTDEGGLQTMTRPSAGQVPIGQSDLSYKPGSAGGVFFGVTSITSVAYTALATDDIILANAVGGAITITLPTAVGIAGKKYTIKRTNAGANAVTVQGTGGQTLDGAATEVLTLQYTSIDVVSDGANWGIF